MSALHQVCEINPLISLKKSIQIIFKKHKKNHVNAGKIMKFDQQQIRTFTCKF